MEGVRERGREGEGGRSMRFEREREEGIQRAREGRGGTNKLLAGRLPLLPLLLSATAATHGTLNELPISTFPSKKWRKIRTLHGKRPCELGTGAPRSKEIAPFLGVPWSPRHIPLVGS